METYVWFSLWKSAVLYSYVCALVKCEKSKVCRIGCVKDKVLYSSVCLVCCVVESSSIVCVCFVEVVVICIWALEVYCVLGEIVVGVVCESVGFYWWCVSSEICSVGAVLQDVLIDYVVCDMCSWSAIGVDWVLAIGDGVVLDVGLLDNIGGTMWCLEFYATVCELLNVVVWVGPVSFA